MTETALPSGWKLLHSKLPSDAFRPISKEVYGVEGLTDVNEGYLIQRLHASGLAWEWKMEKPEYLGAEDRAVRGKDYTNRYYMASVLGRLIIDGRDFDGAGASDNRRVDAAYKGAATVAFKNACKLAGLVNELYLDGRAIDQIYDLIGRQEAAGAEQRPSNSVNGPTPASSVGMGQPATSRPSVEVPPVADKVNLSGATGADERSAPAEVVTTSPAQAPAETPPPPPTSFQPLGGASVSRRMGRSIGPSPKRVNTVTVEPPQSPAPTATAQAVPAPTGLTDEPETTTEAPEPVDEGERQYQATLRQELRKAAAQLTRTNRIYSNKLVHAPKNEAPEEVTPLEPNPDSDESLRLYIDRDFPGRTLADLNTAELQNRLEGVEASLAKKRAVMKERGIAED